MIDKKNGVLARSKKKINHFFTSDHYMLHMTNLATIDATKKFHAKNCLDK